MSAVIVFTPVIIASWPVISAAVVGAVGAMGYSAVNSAVDSINDYQITELNRLKAWLYQQRVKARKEKEKGKRRYEKEETKTQQEMEQPVLFRF